MHSLWMAGARAGMTARLARPAMQGLRAECVNAGMAARRVNTAFILRR